MKLEKTTSRKQQELSKQLALSAAIMFVNSTVVLSAEWAVESSVRMSATYDDNFQLSTIEKSVSGMNLHPKIRLSKRTETSEIILSGHALFNRYDNSRFDSDEILLDLGASFKNTERSTIRLNAGISRKPTLSTEVEDSGRFEVERDKDQITISPSWEYQLSTSSLLQLYYSGQDVDYNGSTALTSYQYHNLGGSYFFRQSEKSQYGITLMATRYDPNSTAIVTTGEYCQFGYPPVIGGGHCFGYPDNRYSDPSKPFFVESQPATSNITDSVGFNVSIDRSFSSTLKGKVKIGLTRSEGALIRDASAYEQANPEVLPENMTPTEVSNAVSTGIINSVTTSTLTTLEVSLTKNYELTSITVSINNSLSPSSNGVLNETTSAGVDIKHKMSPKLDLSADIKVISNQTQSNTRSLGRDYYTAGLGGSWKLTQWWHLGASYRYRQQKYDLASDSTDSNKFAITLAYEWPKKSVSR